ncbi:deleted in autism protein 1-like [Ctenocephalides felis]|uniref:deleted in autism protein 1-like n=1 Tax=Ctenocephalides felis TaxID=7515 RepID=UPI000E6E496F|nr:deleted in autism protein 1-like [Ctenocephalides felis]
MTKIYNSLMLKVIDDGLENNFSLQMCPRMLNYEEYPIAKHLGFCGRLYAQSYMGETINKFYSSDWKIRANITIQLLNAAFVFTFKHEMFRIYLTDISMDNIAVSKSGKVSYIDLEHIILVDKQFENVFSVSYSKWYNNHTSEIIKCDNKDCFAFSPTDICSHNLSDHNIYMTCEMLLNESHNYLHGIPKEINERFPNLVDLLHDCVNPFRANVTKSRFSVSLEIKHMLEESIQILSST